MYKKTFALITEEDDFLFITCDGEPQLIKELIGALNGKEVASRIRVEIEFKEDVIDICRDYCYQVIFDGETGREKYNGRFI